MIPILPTAMYQFDVPAAPTFKPFVGLSLGIAIIHGTVSYRGVSASNTTTGFNGKIHLGAKFGQGENFFSDIRLGVIDGNFEFAPTIGWFF